MADLKGIAEAIIKGDRDTTRTKVEEAIKEKIPAEKILNEGLMAGMSVIGERFKKNEVYVPEVLIAARAMKAGTELLAPLLAEAAWPAHDPELVREDTVTVRIQVNGKLRGTMEVPAGLPEEALRERALGEVGAQQRIANAVAGKQIRKIVVVPDRIVSFVV